MKLKEISLFERSSTELHTLRRSSSGAFTIEDPLVVSEITPFAVKVAWVRNQLRRWAHDNSMEQEDISAEEKAELQHQFVSSIKALNLASNETKAIDPHVVYEMTVNDEVWFLSERPFNLMRWNNRAR